MCGLLTPESSSRITLPPSYAPEADSPGPSSRTARFTMSMSKLSTLIWLSHTFVATFAFKVCGFTLHGCANLIWQSYAPRPHGGPSHSDNILRGRDHRHQTHFQNAPWIVGSDRENRYEPLGKIPSMASIGPTGKETGFHLLEFCTAWAHFYAVEGIFPRSRSSRANNIWRKFRGLLLHLLQPNRRNGDRDLLPCKKWKVCDYNCPSICETIPYWLVPTDINNSNSSTLKTMAVPRLSNSADASTLAFIMLFHRFICNGHDISRSIWPFLLFHSDLKLHTTEGPVYLLDLGRK